MVQLHRRADGAEEAVDLGVDARAALVQRDALRVAGGDAGADARRDIIVSLVPADALPQPLAARADALQGIQQPLGIVIDGRRGLALGAGHAAAHVRVERIAAYLDDFTVQYKAFDAAHRRTIQAHAGHARGAAIIVFDFAFGAVGQRAVGQRVGRRWMQQYQFAEAEARHRTDAALDE